MDVVGSEIGQKMRSAIKAKLTELGCYVDDELPDYVMVMVANKRTRAQMEDDLQLFLGDNTELFVNWLHQVLKKLQEVTVATPALKAVEHDASKERSSSKERKSKDKKSKDKNKKNDLKKAKKKEKEKLCRKKEEKKIHKTKKKSKHHEMIRPNIPPLLMNIEKDSEPSITDVFAGQILKNHGINLDPSKEDVKPEKKPIIPIEVKRSILPIIDPATILSQPEPDIGRTNASVGNVKDDQIKEINQIEAKIQGLKQKLAEQLDISDDEDFLNIRTEAEELMNDFADDVFQEISQQTVNTPPIEPNKSPTPFPPPPIPKPVEVPKESTKVPIEALPQIELKLPKRPVRDRLGVREGSKTVPEAKEKERTISPERFTPDREPDFRVQKSAKSRLGVPSETSKITSDDGNSDKSSDSSIKKVTSRVSVLENRPSRSSCASVVRVRPRPRVATPASSLLLRAVADAHKSLLNTPSTKMDIDSQQIKRALVLPMRRCVDMQKIVIQVPADNSQETGDSISLGGDMDSDDERTEKIASEKDKNEYIPSSITKKIVNNEYTPSRRNEGRTTSVKDDTLIIETINIHTPLIDKDKNTQFIVTMDGYHPNAFLAKKLQTEGLLNDEDEISKTNKDKTKSPGTKEPVPPKEVEKEVSGPTETLEKVVEPQKKAQQSNELEKKLQTSEPPKKQIIEPLKKQITEPLKKQISEPPKKQITEPPKEKISEPPNKQISELPKKQISEPPKKQISEPQKSQHTSDSSDEIESPVVVKREEDKAEKRKVIELKEDPPIAKKRKASPIVFDVEKRVKEAERVRERTESASSDSHVTVTTVTNSHKYDSVPPLSAAERKLVWCRAFPACRYGSSCAFAHPRCKFLATCTRRNCVYSHAPNALPLPIVPAAPTLASHVVPAANYKTITAIVPNMCKFYPNCVNPACHFYHPKPCRYGNSCANKLECNFFHADVPPKWRYPV